MFATMTALTALDLSNNALSGSLPPSAVALCVSPGTSCNFNGNSVTTTLAAFLGSWPSNGRTFAIPNGITLSGSGGAQLMIPNFASVTMLTAIALHGLGLTGTIPTSLTSLMNLKYLDLSGNSLNGTIPDIWGSFRQLTYLGLNDNNLEGYLPPSLGGLMANIRVTSNAGLSGPVPYNVLTNTASYGQFMFSGQWMDGTALTLPEAPGYSVPNATCAVTCPVTDASNAAVAALQTSISAMNATYAAQLATLGASNAALQSTVALQNATLGLLLAGFCPPASTGRHLLSMTPIVPPAECIKPAPAPPSNVVATTLSLSGIDLLTFKLSNVAAAIAATAGVTEAEVNVTVADYQASATYSFAGVALRSLTPAQQAGVADAILAQLPSKAMKPTLGAVTPGDAGHRHLLDLSFPVTITGIGPSAAAVNQTLSALTSTATVGSIARAASVPPSAVTASAATISVTLSVSVLVASSDMAAAVGAALSPGNAAGLAAQLASMNVTSAGVIIASPPPPPPLPSLSPVVSHGTSDRRLLPLFVLLVLVVLCAGFLLSKCVEYRRRLQALERTTKDDIVLTWRPILRLDDDDGAPNRSFSVPIEGTDVIKLALQAWIDAADYFEPSVRQ